MPFIPKSNANSFFFFFLIIIIIMYPKLYYAPIMTCPLQIFNIYVKKIMKFVPLNFLNLLIYQGITMPLLKRGTHYECEVITNLKVWPKWMSCYLKVTWQLKHREV